MASATYPRPQLCGLLGLCSSHPPTGIPTLGSWLPSAHLRSWISCCHPSSVCVQPGELGGGRRLCKTDIRLVLRACIINKTSLTWHVQYEPAAGHSGSFWVWPKSHSWKQGGILSLLLEFVLEFDAMCNMSPRAYPPSPQGPPRPCSLGFLSFSSATARSLPLTSVTC